MDRVSRPCILAVDDDQRMLDLFHSILDEDYRVLDATDGTAALALLAAERVDLLLLDILIQGLDGIALLERLGSAARRVPVVVVSGLNAACTAATAMRLGAIDYVTKPFEIDQLLATIDAAFGSCRPRTRPPKVLLVGCDLAWAAVLAAFLGSVARVAIAGAAWSLDALDVGTDLVVATAAAAGVRDVPNVLRLGRGARFGEALERIRRAVAPVAADVKSLEPRVLAILEAIVEGFPTFRFAKLGRELTGSPYYLSRLFRSETGLPLKPFLNRVQVEAAKQLLVTTDEKLDAIAERVGLHDASHLSRLFVKHTGQRPGEMRRSAE